MWVNKDINFYYYHNQKFKFSLNEHENEDDQDQDEYNDGTYRKSSRKQRKRISTSTTTSTRTSDTTNQKSYIVDTPGCKIIDFDPFNSEIKPYYFNNTGIPYDCSTNQTTKLIRINGNQFYISSFDNKTCFARGLIRTSDTRLVN